MKRYILNNNAEISALKSYGFKYSGVEDKCIVPIYLYKDKHNKKIPLIFLSFTINISDKFFGYTVINKDNTLHSAYYNKDGNKNNKVLNTIERNIQKELSKLEMMNIITVKSEED
ncbi:hypothetical protein [Konateibacter massiliensis]|uniref:hypothetical protein n=1 Tax=Konateibacter massiliensis TaxID=2002841 RepID=UPI000C14FE68|nr:hypothetical protein [Konateibacter massiliensis]